jgi:PPIC-type PPIASE domain
LLRRALGIACVLAAAAVIAVPLGGQSGSPTDFVVLKVEDLSSSGVHLAIIVTNTKADADAARRQLEAGAAFDRVAAERSRHPTAAAGGDFGVFPLGDLRPEFRTGIDGVKPGGYTPVLAVDRSAIPPGWPEALPAPGTSLRNVERALGRG